MHEKGISLFVVCKQFELTEGVMPRQQCKVLADASADKHAFCAAEASPVVHRLACGGPSAVLAEQFTSHVEANENQRMYMAGGADCGGQIADATQLLRCRLSPTHLASESCLPRAKGEL